MNRPIYFFTGFLDSGKTTSIKRTLEDPRFTENEKTLILCLEEGDEAYDEGFLNACHCVIEYVDYNDLNTSFIKKLDDKYKPDRIFIEFNGMNDDKEILNMPLPNDLEYAQIICNVDTSKFKLFVTNMPQFMFNHICVADTVVLNRYEGADFKYLRNNIKSMNRNALIVLENENGQMLDLPMGEIFDPNNLNISDDDYGLFYMDVVDNINRYEDKKVSFNGFYLDDAGNDKVIGRFAMVCCANDTQRLAMRVKNLKEKMTIGKYYHIDGIIKLQRQNRGIFLYIEALNAKEIPAPEMEYVSFN